MPTLTVGFRLGNDVTGRQATVLVTENGLLHRSRGAYGKAPQFSQPEVSPALYSHMPNREGEHRVATPVAGLRRYHAYYLARGYTRALVPPVCLKLDVEEVAPGRHERPSPDAELLAAFLGQAPQHPQSLDEAVRDFHTALGRPSRPAGVSWVPRQAPVPPRVEAMLRTLAQGKPLVPARRQDVGWRVTREQVRLHAGPVGAALDREAVLDLQAALSAWLRFTQTAPPPASSPDLLSGGRGDVVEQIRPREGRCE